MADKDTLEEEKAAFERARDAESTMRQMAREAVRFARLGEQWPEKVKKAREQEMRPVLTVNRIPSFVRQVVNDARQNKPQIKVKAVDNAADPKTAEIIAGIIRNIEAVSKADIAYDTAVESACYGGFGYIKLRVDYLYDDQFDKGIFIDRVANPFTIYGDPDATCADGSTWNRGFETERLTKAEFEAKYKGADKVDWDEYEGLSLDWMSEDEGVTVAASWLREKVKTKIYKLSDDTILDQKRLDELLKVIGSLEAVGLSVVGERDSQTYKVTQRIMTGAEVLETNEWAGKYIPLIPVYGEEFNIEGQRHFLSLHHHAQDAQRMLNYWRSTSTELVALAPKVPFIGKEGSFDADPNWQTANSASHPYLMYSGDTPPSRLPIDSGPAAGALQEAMTASDDMKSIMGLYDASLGAKSNETSGVAIQRRQAEGDVSTFHFIDNLARSIRHVGCCIVDLAPSVYTHGQVVRILGDDGKEANISLGPSNAQSPQQAEQQDMPEVDPGLAPYEQKAMEREMDLNRVYDLSVGKYDVVVESGPSYTTRRAEIAAIMTEMIRSVPEAAPVILPKMVKHLDIPDADEMSEQLEKLNPGGEGKLPPEAEKQMQEMSAALEQKDGELQQASTELQKKDTDLQKASIELAKKDLELFRQEIVNEIQGIADASSQERAKSENEAKDRESKMQIESAKASQQESTKIIQAIGKQIDTIAPAVAKAVAEVFAQMPPPPPAPKRIRTAVRDKQGLITHMVEEDEPAATVQ